MLNIVPVGESGQAAIIFVRLFHMVLIAQFVAGLLLLLEVPGQFLGVEVRYGLQPVVQVFRVRVAAKVAPRNEARNDETVQFGRRWRGEWKKEYRDGPCKVKIEAKRDEFKEEMKCE